MIEHFRQISYLNLEWNKLTDKDVQLLAPMFKLKGLNLGMLKFTQRLMISG